MFKKFDPMKNFDYQNSVPEDNNDLESQKVKKF